MVVFGARELPNPKGEGYLYYKLPPSRREYFVSYLNLINTSGEEVKAVFARAVGKAKADLIAKGHTEEISAKTIETENIEDWAVELLKEILSCPS